MNRLVLIVVVASALASARGEVPGASFGLPVPSDDVIPLGQGFEHKPNVPDRSVYTAQNVRFVWGADYFDQPAGVVASEYIPVNRSPRAYLDPYNLAWYKKNHPDWIVYRGDRTTLAYSYIYPVIGGLPPLNMTDPAVLDFYFDTFVLPVLRKGYGMVAVDNVEFVNWEGAAGHFNPKGEWVQLYGPGKHDAAFAASQIGRLKDLQRRLHPMGKGVAANISFATAPPDVIRRACDSCDLWADEGGLSYHGGKRITDKTWADKVAFVLSLPPARSYLPIDTLPSADASRNDLEWIVANFLLVRGPRSLLLLRWDATSAEKRKPKSIYAADGSNSATLNGQKQFGTFNSRPELKINLGKPTAEPVRTESGAWVRTYQDGVVVVNPSSTQTALVMLPAGEWQDFDNQRQSGELRLAPASAKVLRDQTVPPI